MTGGVEIEAPFRWTDERVETLKRLWRGMATSTQIQNEIGGGVTRSGVVGKLHRLGLLGGRRTGRPDTKNVTLKRKPVAPAPPAEAALPVVRGGRPAALSVVVAKQPIVEEGVDILDLRASQCRWIIAGEKEHARYCGAGTPDIKASYCARHAAMAYAGVTTREERLVQAELRKRGALA